MAPRHETVGAVIRDRHSGRVPSVAVVLGSGLGAVGDLIEKPTVIDYADLPGFPRPTVSGHAGRVVSGELAGAAVMILQGRAHAYEGHAMADLALPARALQAAGVEILVLTNAAGGLRDDLAPGRSWRSPTI